MKRLFEKKMGAKDDRRVYIFLKDRYGHNRVNIGFRSFMNFHMSSSDIRALCADPRFDQNAFISSDRIVFNGLKPEDLSPEEFAMYQQDLIIDKF